MLVRYFATTSSCWQRHVQSLSQNRVPVPCVEPHCSIECSNIYETNDKNGIIHSELLTKVQQQHLLIDMGHDSIVQKLISFIPPYKLCPYRQQTGSLFKKSANVTIKLYPIVFGFIDHFMPNTISRQVLINGTVIAVNQTCLPKKTKDFSELIPGKIQTYKFRFENELDYRRLYSTAYYAVTMKKGGWDCNRHYEIISSGTMPFFDQLNKAGDHTLSFLPKSILYAAQAIPGVNRDNLSIDHKLFDLNQYNLLLHRLLYYAKHRLTTVKLVEYVLKTIKYPLNYTQNHSVLFISRYPVDYLKDFMLHGLTHIFEENLHVFQAPRYMYQYPMSKMWTPEETTDFYKEKLYGMGYGFKLTLNNYAHLYDRDKKDLSSLAIVENNIKSKKYSLIVYGSINREHSAFFVAKEHYEPSRIVALDGDDELKDVIRSEYAKYATYFLREIPDDCNLIL